MSNVDILEWIDVLQLFVKNYKTFEVAANIAKYSLFIRPKSQRSRKVCKVWIGFRYDSSLVLINGKNFKYKKKGFFGTIKQDKT